MRILGFDPGTATTGWACIEQKNRAEKPSLLDCGTIKTLSNEPLPKRLLNLYNLIIKLIQNYKPDQIAVEELFFAKNRKTAIAVSHARGVILLAAALNKINVGEYTPMQVKLALVGYGHADKNQVQEMLKHHIDAEKYPTQDDTADAVAIALTHLTNVSSITK